MLTYTVPDAKQPPSTSSESRYHRFEPAIKDRQEKADTEETHLGGRLSDNRDKSVSDGNRPTEADVRQKGDMDLMGEMDPSDTKDPRDVTSTDRTSTNE